MNDHREITMSREELDAGLARLGVRELEERMEVSPLLAAGDIQAYDRCTCELGCSTIDVPDMQDPVFIEIDGWSHLGY